MPGPQRIIARAAAPALGLAGVFYFSVQGMDGRYGYRALELSQARSEQAAAELRGLEEARAALSSRADRLSTDKIDADMLDEVMRRVFHYAEPGEMVVPREELSRILTPEMTDVVDAGAEETAEEPKTQPAPRIERAS